MKNYLKIHLLIRQYLFHLVVKRKNYRRAITESGGGLRTIGYGHIFRDKDAALRDGEAFFRQLGAASLAEARALPAETIFAKAEREPMPTESLPSTRAETEVSRIWMEAAGCQEKNATA